MIETERLILRNWREEDVLPMSKVSGDPDVMRYFPSVQNIEYTEKFVRRMIQMFEKRDYCYFAAEDKSDKKLIGFIGLAYQDYDAQFTPCVDIGWRLSKDKWGKGFATEGARACLDYAKKMKLNQIVSVATSSNLPSINVMKKIGMTYQYKFEHVLLKDYPHLSTCDLYSIDL